MLHTYCHVTTVCMLTAPLTNSPFLHLAALLAVTAVALLSSIVKKAAEGAGEGIFLVLDVRVVYSE